MEIVDYLKVARAQLGLILLIPLVAAAAVLGIHYAGAPSYEATAYVFVPPDGSTQYSNPYAGPSGPSNWLNAFDAAATSPTVTRKVARQTGVPVSDLGQGVAVSAVNQSWALETTFSWHDATVARRVVRGVAVETLHALLAPQVAQHRRDVREAEARLAAVDRDIVRAITNGEVSPDGTYIHRMHTVARLQRQQAALLAQGQTTTAGELGRSLVRARANLQLVAEQHLRYQTLLDRRSAAATALSNAEENLQSTSLLYAGASGHHVITLLPVTTPGIVDVLIRGVLPALIIGLVLALALVAVLEARGWRPRSVRIRQHRSVTEPRFFGRGETAQ